MVSLSAGVKGQFRLLLAATIGAAVVDATMTNIFVIMIAVFVATVSAAFFLSPLIWQAWRRDYIVSLATARSGHHMVIRPS
jgi:hypothetical protein